MIQAVQAVNEENNETGGFDVLMKAIEAVNEPPKQLIHQNEDNNNNENDENKEELMTIDKAVIILSDDDNDDEPKTKKKITSKPLSLLQQDEPPIGKPNSLTAKYRQKYAITSKPSFCCAEP